MIKFAKPSLESLSFSHWTAKPNSWKKKIWLTFFRGGRPPSPLTLSPSRNYLFPRPSLHFSLLLPRLQWPPTTIAPPCPPARSYGPRQSLRHIPPLLWVLLEKLGFCLHKSKIFYACKEENLQQVWFIFWTLNTPFLCL